MQVYFPRDLVHNKRGYLLGQSFAKCVVVCECTDTAPARLPPHIEVVGLINLDVGPLRFTNDFLNRFPYLPSSLPCFVVVFLPPNYKNFEYFLILPILLQLVGALEPRSPDVAKIAALPLMAPLVTLLANELVLDAVNTTLETRKRIREVARRGEEESESTDGSTSDSAQASPPPSTTTTEASTGTTEDTSTETNKESIDTNTTDTNITDTNITNVTITTTATATTETTTPLHTPPSRFAIAVHHLQHATSTVRHRLRPLARHLALVRQLDLRLSQLTNLPVQFGCYKGWLLVKLPVFNSNVNVANSNYINFYNGLWLVFNDVLLGRALLLASSEWMRELGGADTVVHLVDSTLFAHLHRYILWVAEHHPAGFKLNDELGRFMGDLYGWTLGWWRHTVGGGWLALAAMAPAALVVCSLGATFALAAIIDVVVVLALHLRVFYTIAAKVYHRHLKVVLSLFQLFQGKKHNVLRHRVDSEDYETDQLLMGTLMAVVLVLLLPTVLAFYWLFFVAYGLVLVAVNALEDVQTVLNCLPLFPGLLKVKNLSRLQGGVTFGFLGFQGSTLFVSLENKALGWGEIFRYFPRLFARYNAREILRGFLWGEPFEKRDLSQVLANYLMFPEEAVDIGENSIQK